MFTGLIQGKGRILKRSSVGKSARIAIGIEKPFADLKRGESISVNGVCLTLEKSEKGKILHFFMLQETLKKTNLKSLPVASQVNIERALQTDDRLGGHIVTGHVDGIAKVKKLEKSGSDWKMSIEFPEELAPMIALKGNVALDGVSLTIAELAGEILTVHLIPETFKVTALKERTAGSSINIETDILAKYVCRILNVGKSVPNNKNGAGLNAETLRNAGWEL